MLQHIAEMPRRAPSAAGSRYGAWPASGQGRQARHGGDLDPAIGLGIASGVSLLFWSGGLLLLCQLGG